jgi:hypothetical protein
MQFWAGLGRNHLFHVLKTAKHLFWKQGCPKKGHASVPLTPFAPPENGKTFIQKTRMSVFGTINIMMSFCCIPSKQQNLYPENKNVRFWD